MNIKIKEHNEKYEKLKNTLEIGLLSLRKVFDENKID